MAEAITPPVELKTLEEHIEYFLAQGFKQVKDVQQEISRTLTFRKFADGDAIEVTLKQIGSMVTVKQTVNGK